MARKTNILNDDTMPRLYKTRAGRYGAIVGARTRLRYIPDEDGLIYVEDNEDLHGFLTSGGWAVYTEKTTPRGNPFEEIMKDDDEFSPIGDKGKFR